MSARPTGPARRIELSRAQCLDRLAGVAAGHVVFSHQKLPAIGLVHHLVDDGWVVVTRSRKSLSPVGSDAVCGVVAYEADEIDPATRTGWCGALPVRRVW
ncbi:pyridoxamine 5'-phosphate oxidase family protein [Streptomyces sp. cg2]|uniref:pyridoxamine 5'-phosphate oxidase family protein n=1 Tax=Streptomyces sp. cg2 TaxID=3238799 RepID=UPI0034E23EC9